MDGAEKVRVEVELDRALVDLAGKAGLDLSDVADRAVKRALGPERLKASPPHALRMEELRRELRPEIAWYNAHVARHGLFADEWRKF